MEQGRGGGMGKISKGLSLRSRPLQSPSRASPVPALPRGSPGAVRGCPPAPGPTLAHIPLPGGRAGGTAGSLAPCPPSPCLPHVQGEAARSSPSLGLVSRQQPRSSSPGSLSPAGPPAVPAICRRSRPAAVLPGSPWLSPCPRTAVLRPPVEPDDSREPAAGSAPGNTQLCSAGRRNP